jgi:hypothetical protein
LLPHDLRRPVGYYDPHSDEADGHQDLRRPSAQGPEEEEPEEAPKRSGDGRHVAHIGTRRDRHDEPVGKGMSHHVSVDPEPQPVNGVYGEGDELRTT